MFTSCSPNKQDTTRWRPVHTIVSLTIYGLVMTMSYDLLTSKSKPFIFVPKCTKVVNLAKFPKQFMKCHVQRLKDGWTHACTHGWTTHKHNASNAYGELGYNKMKWLSLYTSNDKDSLSPEHLSIHTYVSSRDIMITTT